jgi:predicted aspartyl protease
MGKMSKGFTSPERKRGFTMETEIRGRVKTEATIESLHDIYASQHALISADQIRRIVVPDALVDDGTMLLSLPLSLIRRLGLAATKSRHVARGSAPVVKYDPVRLTIMGRDCTMEVLEALEGAPVVVGRIALLNLDLVVDQAASKLTGNPAHGGEWVLEMY